MGLAYPCGMTPGFDPTHIAASGISAKGHVGVSSGGGWLNVLTGIPGTINTAAPSVIDGVTGPSYVGANDTSGFTFPGSATAENTFTLAALVRPTSFPATGTIFFSSATTNTGNGLVINNTSIVRILAGVTNILNGPTLSANSPYFIAGSRLAGSTVNLLVLNLNTGVLLTSTGTNATNSAASDGTYVVGKSPAFNAQSGRNAAVMYNPALFLSMSELRAWAADPWAFWYPGMDS